MPNDSTYVEQRDGGYWIRGSRVSFDSIVTAFKNGHHAELIQESFPSLDQEQVYGAITFYLAHRDQVDAYLAEGEAAFERDRQRARAADPVFYERLAAARLRNAG